MKFVGYITSDPLSFGFIPHNVQNFTIKNFLTKNDHQFLLSWTEYKNHSKLAFNSLCDENYFQGICFFSWEQLSTFPDVKSKLNSLLEKGFVLSFAREGFFIKNQNELDPFLEKYFLSRCIFQNGDFRQWLNERKKYF